jgi:beta-lactamase regulating signal transducer with metallopeptidase domain
MNVEGAMLPITDPAPLWEPLPTLVWQTTLLLALGLLVAALLRRHPARAHFVLLLAVIGALLVPVANGTVRALGLGLLPARVETVPAQVEEHAAVQARVAPVDRRAPSAPDALDADVDPTAFQASPARPSSRGGGTAAMPVTAPSLSGFDARLWLLVAWAAASSVLALRSFRAWRQARRLVASSETVGTGPLRIALDRNGGRMGLGHAPRLAASADVACPMIWGWSRPAVLLVPADAGHLQGAALDWDAVITHELAHLQRRDHWAQSLAALLCTLLPWNPLAWWVRATLSRRAELACDDWVLAAGRSPAGYAETLLSFAAARSREWTVAAVSSRTGLRRRLTRILAGAAASPEVGMAWRRVGAAVLLLAIVAVACAQPGPTIVAQHPATPAQGQPAAPQTVLPVAAATASTPALLRGLVIDPAGSPVAGVSLRVFRKEPREEELWLRGTLVTDAAGSFSFGSGPRDRHWWVRIEDPRFAFQWFHPDAATDDETEARPVRLQLQEARRVAGQVVDEDGHVVAGARVTLTSEYVTDPETRADTIGGPATERFTETDADGRFALENLQGRWVTLMLEHPEFAQTFSPSDPRLETGRDDVRLVIQRGLTLRGQVLADGRPLAGVPIRSAATCLADRPLGHWNAVTDDEGRFELRGVSTKVSRTPNYVDMPLVGLSVDTPEWVSPHYSVYDSYSPELAFVTIEAAPRPSAPSAGAATKAAESDTGSSPPAKIEVDRPSSGTLARLRGHPSGTASASISVIDPVFHHGRLTIYLQGTDSEGRDVGRDDEADEAGHVLFDQLPAGSYSVWLPGIKANYPVVSFELHDGEALPVTVKRLPNRIHGTVTCGDVPVTAGVIDVIAVETEPPDSFYQGYGVVHEDGTWECAGLPRGRYRFTFDHGYGHSVPNYFFADVGAGETRFDIALPRTRIDISVEGRDIPPEARAEAEAIGTTVWFDIKACPAGTAPMGGNTCGTIPIGNSHSYIEHVPPGRWALTTRGADFGLFSATVTLDSDTSQVQAVLRRSNNGSGRIAGSWTPSMAAGVAKDCRLVAYSKSPAGLDVIANYGVAEFDDGAFRITGLKAGTYGVLLSPPTARRNVDDDDSPLPFVYAPDVRVPEGGETSLDIVIPESRVVDLRMLGPDGETCKAVWRIDLGGGDWLPYHLFVGSEPRALIAIPTAFPLPVGEHRLETTVLEQAPRVHVFQVETGSGVQTIDFVVGD